MTEFVGINEEIFVNRNELVEFAAVFGIDNVQMLVVPLVELDTHVDPVFRLITELS